jgi:hypothetical protein
MRIDVSEAKLAEVRFYDSRDTQDQTPGATVSTLLDWREIEKVSSYAGKWVMTE